MEVVGFKGCVKEKDQEKSQPLGFVPGRCCDSDEEER